MLKNEKDIKYWVDEAVTIGQWIIVVGAVIVGIAYSVNLSIERNKRTQGY